MLAVVKSVGLYGLDGHMVDVEVNVSTGLPGFEVVGLPSSAVREARERVRAAVRNSRMEFPMGRITVNLAPADLRKEGPVFDLPIAVGILAATGQLANDSYRNYIFLGELSLDGSVRAVTGVLPSILTACRHQQNARVIVPLHNADEASLVDQATVYPAAGLTELRAFLNGQIMAVPYQHDFRKISAARTDSCVEDMADVRGQYNAKRALEIAAAGGHNVMMTGPPGSGKTMLARRMAGIMPEISLAEALDITKVYSVSGLLPNGKPLITERPFRDPHHNISRGGMVGGGRIPKPGEISLAHHGVLFMDEFAEFSRDTLESLRQPLEEGRVCIARVNGSVHYPARFILVAAMNPCPCGYYGDSTRECTCSPLQIVRYQGRVTGPMMDRIDIHIQVPRITYNDLQTLKKAEGSGEIRRRVEKARLVQHSRLAGTGIETNAGMGGREVRRFCHIEGKAARLLQRAYESLGLSARAYSRILKVARTIADLAGRTGIGENDVAEAVQYRSTDMTGGFSGNRMAKE